MTSRDSISFSEDSSKDQFIRYLIGSLSEGEEEEVVERMFGDQQEFELLQEVENWLVDEYARGRLLAEQRELFERNYLITEERRVALSVARQLEREKERHVAVRRASPRSVQTRWWLAAAAAAAVAVVGLSVYKTRSRVPAEPPDLDRLAALEASQITNHEIRRGGKSADEVLCFIYNRSGKSIVQDGSEVTLNAGSSKGIRPQTQFNVIYNDKASGLVLVESVKQSTSEGRYHGMEIDRTYAYVQDPVPGLRTEFDNETGANHVDRAIQVGEEVLRYLPEDYDAATVHRELVRLFLARRDTKGAEQHYNQLKRIKERTAAAPGGGRGYRPGQEKQPDRNQQ